MTTTPPDDFRDQSQQPPAGGQDGAPSQGAGYPPNGPQPYGQPYGPPHDQYGQQQHGYPPYEQQQYGQAPSSDDRTIAVLAHLSPLVGIVLSLGLLSWLAPLIVWFVWRGRGPLVRNAAASAFNFNVTVWVANAIGWVCAATFFLLPVAIVLWAGAFIAQLIFSVKGAVSANRGEVYRYPLQVPILS